MTTALFSPAFADQIILPAGKFNDSIKAHQQDLQTGLVDVDFSGQPRHTLLFARGTLVNVYRHQDVVERLDPLPWLESLNGSAPIAALRVLTLTPQALRILKIMIEQGGDRRTISAGELSLEQQLAAWAQHPGAALAHVRWPNAVALTMLAGQSAIPRYTLFVAEDRILHSATSINAILKWREKYTFAALFSSEPRTPAWAEYLLHHAVSRLISSLLQKLEKLTGRMVYNQIIHDINFTASAHDWNVGIYSSSLTDQAIFASPTAAADIYLRLLQAITGCFGAVLGNDALDLLVSDTVLHLSLPCRTILKEYRLVKS